ncbi:MAG: DUF2939 domain-containing protein [Nitrospira sp.]|nr:DUF2939 domain-containing protein [Nitrospira sp.]
MNMLNPVSKKEKTPQLSHIIINDDFQGATSEGRRLILYFFRSLVSIFFKSVVVIAFCVWIYAGPYLALSNIREAAEAGDTEALSDVIDLPSVRESLKQEIKAAGLQAIRESNGNPAIILPSLGAYTPLPDLLIDSVLTLEVVATLILGKEPTSISLGLLGIDRSNAYMGYEGLSKFALRYKNAKTGNDAIVVLLRRDGISWQLSAIHLPILREHKTHLRRY